MGGGEGECGRGNVGAVMWRGECGSGNVAIIIGKADCTANVIRTAHSEMKPNVLQRVTGDSCD
jgi:hypothetical protein